MGGFYQSKRDQKYQAELSEMFSDVRPPIEQQTESADEFTLDPIGFEEMTESLCRDTDVLFAMASTRHRLSEAFLVTTGNLEKLIRRLGSCCLTKAALEAAGRTFPNLEGLDIRQLYCLGSFNFRKCHASIQDGISRMQRFNMDMMNMECKWFTTLQRLKATEEKITLIREGKISIDSLIKRDGFCKDNSSSPRETSGRHTEFGKADSFPILRSALEDEIPGAALGIGTSREPKTNWNIGGGRIIRRPSPAQLRKEIERSRKRKEAEAKAREKAEAEERSQEVVREAVSAVMAHNTAETPMEKFKAESQKSAVRKWAEIWEKYPPGELPPAAAPARQKPGKKKKKR